MAGMAKFDRRNMVKAASLGALAAFTQPVAWALVVLHKCELGLVRLGLLRDYGGSAKCLRRVK
jgi:hypothetical protein